MRSEPKREKDKANSEELEGERESSQQSGYTMFFWLHCLSCMDILPFHIYNSKKRQVWHDIIYSSTAKQAFSGLSSYFFFFFTSLCNVCFKQWWHITADKWDIFFSAHRALILHIYGYTCMLAHTCMNARGAKRACMAVGMKSWRENKRGWGFRVWELYI